MNVLLHTEYFSVFHSVSAVGQKFIRGPVAVRMHHAQIKTQCALAGWLLVKQVAEAIGGSAVES